MSLKEKNAKKIIKSLGMNWSLIKQVNESNECNECTNFITFVVSANEEPFLKEVSNEFTE